MIACAYLRVFQPIDSFPPDERTAWERYIVRGGHREPPPRVYRERWTSAGGRLGVLTADEDRADVRLVDGSWYVCPWRTRLRILAGLLSLRETVPSEVAEALVPEAEARRAARELARVKKRDPSAAPTMLQSTWHVPVRWFVLVDDSERRLEEREEGGYRLSYWTPIVAARHRADRALRVLRRTDLEMVTELVGDMAQWLAVFDQTSAVELDYGDVADQFTWTELEEDHSARDLAEAIDALESGDPSRAGELYQQVAGRWAEARTRESLN